MTNINESLKEVKKINTKLRELRKNANLSQTELADRLGVGQTAVSMWERGQASPATGKLTAIADALNCTVDELLRGEADNEQIPGAT